MKRGFLNTEKGKKAISQNPDDQGSKAASHVVSGTQVKVDDLPGQGAQEKDNDVHIRGPEDLSPSGTRFEQNRENRNDEFGQPPFHPIRPTRILCPASLARHLIEPPSASLGHKSIPPHPPTLSNTLNLTKETMRRIIEEDFPDGLDEQQYCEVLLRTDTMFEILDYMPSVESLKPIPSNKRVKEADVKGKGKEGETPKLYEVRDTGDNEMGLGIFATKGLFPGELVLAERPLMILPKKPMDLAMAILGPGREEKNALAEEFLGDTHEKFLEAHLATLLPMRQAQFLALSPAKFPPISGEECKRPLRSRVKTNGIEIPSGTVINPFSPQNGGVIKENIPEYIGICNDLSRINHSCTPNAALSFDAKSWTFQLHPLHTVSAGEQLFVSYVPILLPVKERARSLEKLGFACQCGACTNPSPASIAFRVSFERTVHELEEGYEVWLRDPQASDTQVIDPARELLTQAEEERLFATSAYGRLLSLIFHCYCANGDEENTRVYQVKTFTWYAARDPRERDTYKEWIDDQSGEKLVNKYHIWKARIKVRRNAVAWSGRERF